MKRTFATFEHSLPGFPEVLLKWSEGASHPLRDEPGRIVVKGVITGYFRWSEPESPQQLESDLARFDAWVGKTYAEDASVQG